MLIYLDTCAIQRPLDDQGQLRVRVEGDILLTVIAAVEAGEFELVSSAVLRFETENNPIVTRRNFARSVLSLSTVDIDTTTVVVERARYFKEVGIKPLDAVHLASACVANAGFFCTVDDDFLREARAANTGETRVVSPHELITGLAL